MGQAQLSHPFYSQGAAPPFPAAKSPSSQLERRADSYLPPSPLAARPAAAWAPFSSFEARVFKAASPPCLARPRRAAGRTFPACWREEKRRSDGEEMLQLNAAEGRRGVMRTGIFCQKK